MDLVFAFVAAPLFFFMMTWTAVTVYRLYCPEEPLPPERDPRLMREIMRRAGESVPVGAREIREDQRRCNRGPRRADYRWGGAPTTRLPDAWTDDVWMRRN